MANFDTKTLYNFEKYLELQRSGKYNMVSPEAREALGLSKEEHQYIIKNYSEILKEYESLKVVDEIIADAKSRVNGDVGQDKTMGFNKSNPETNFEN